MSILVLQIILMGKRDLVALLCLSSWRLVIVVWLFLPVPWVCLQFVIVVFPYHTHLLFLFRKTISYMLSADHVFVEAYACYRPIAVAVIFVNREFSIQSFLPI